MAFTYGSVTKCKVGNGTTRNEYECRFGYEVQSQSIANNTSSVKLRLQVRSISSTYKTYGYNQTSTIDGTKLSAASFDMRDTNTWQTFGERTITVTHNTNGTYSASKSGSFTTTASGDYSLKSGSASVTVAPATIPRYATSNQSLASKTSSSITMNWSSDSTVDYIWYSKDNGSNWTGVDVTDGTSGSYTISGLSANTTYNIKTRVRRKDSQLTTDSSTLSVTTHQTTTASISVSSKTETSVTVSSSSNVTVSNTRYRIMKSGGSYGSWQTSATFSGLSANSTYTVQVEKVGQASGEAGYATVSVTTYEYPYCTESPNFKIGDAVTLKFNNPLNRTFSFTVIANGVEIYTWTNVTGTSYTGVNGQEAVTKLYASIPDKPSATYKVKVVYSGITKERNNGNTYSIKGNEYPTFNNFSYQDTNAKTVGLTGNNQILVNGYSNLKVTISTDNKAYSNYGSPIDKYRLNVGNMSSVEKAYSSTAAVELSVNSVNSPSITVTAIDKRGYPKQQPKTATFKAYFKPVIKSMSVTRSDGGVGSQVTLAFNGEWWNDNFGAYKNKLTEAKYYYKKTTESTWTQGNIAIIPTINGNNFSGSVIIEGPASDKGFDVSTAYNIKMTIQDELVVSSEYQLTLSSGTPALAIYENGVAINKMFEEGNTVHKLQVGGRVKAKGEFYSAHDEDGNAFNGLTKDRVMSGVTYRGKVGVGTSQVDGRWSEGATCIEAIKLNADSEELNGRLEVCQDGTIYNAILKKRMMEAPDIVTNSMGTALKYPDGTLICYATLYSEASFNSWGNLYGFDDNTVRTFPVAFTTNPFVSLTNTRRKCSNSN